MKRCVLLGMCKDRWIHTAHLASYSWTIQLGTEKKFQLVHRHRVRLQLLLIIIITQLRQSEMLVTQTKMQVTQEDCMGMCERGSSVFSLSHYSCPRTTLCSLFIQVFNWYWSFLHRGSQKIILSPPLTVQFIYTYIQLIFPCLTFIGFRQKL